MATINRCKTPTSKNDHFQEVYDAFLLSRKTLCAKSTVDTYRNFGKSVIIPKLIEYCQTMDDVNEVVLRAIINDYAETHSVGGVHFFYRHFKAFVRWYWAEYDIQRPAPFRNIKVKKPKLPPKEGISRSEVEALIKAANEHSFFPERDIALIMILCDTGIRLSSLASLKIADVDTAKKELTVWEKDQQYHIKPFGTACSRAVNKYLRCIVDAHPDESLWLQMDGSPVAKRGLREILRRLCREANIEEHHFHDFRRFYGLELYKSTHDIYFVSRALDHKSIEVTKRYLAIDALEDAEAMRSMSPMDNKNTAKIKRKKK